MKITSRGDTPQFKNVAIIYEILLMLLTEDFIGSIKLVYFFVVVYVFSNKKVPFFTKNFKRRLRNFPIALFNLIFLIFT